MASDGLGAELASAIDDLDASDDPDWPDQAPDELREDETEPLALEWSEDDEPQEDE